MSRADPGRSVAGGKDWNGRTFVARVSDSDTVLQLAWLGMPWPSPSVYPALRVCCSCSDVSSRSNCSSSRLGGECRPLVSEDDEGGARCE